jgi:DNA-binding MarR family transcriptional regulator
MPRVKHPARPAPPASADPAINEIVQTSRAWSTATVVMHSALAARLGLHATDHKAVDVLLQHGPLTAGELADRMALTNSAVTTMVDRLERVGLVRRDRDPVDRRRVIVRPTVSADFERRFLALMAPMMSDYGELLEGLSRAELDMVRRFLEGTRAITERQIRRLRAGEQGG